MFNRTMLNRNTLVAIACLSTSFALTATPAGAAGASERYGIDPDFPVRIEDAYPLDYGKTFFKLSSRFAQAENGSDTTLIQPEVAWGFAPNFDVHVLSPNFVGDGDRAGSGDINVNVQWLPFPEVEGKWYPAVAIEGDLIAPTGSNSDGVDTVLQLNMTKTLAWAPSFDAVHVNLTWTHNFEDEPTQRDDGYNAIVGYSRRILDDTVLIADFVWEQTLTKHAAANTFELGFIQQVGEHVQLSAGAGVGVGDDSPDYTVTVGVIITR